MKLGLGTAQFGLDYGISNAAGRPPESEVAGLVAEAITAGVQIFDTAPAYGESEAVLGRVLPTKIGVKIVTKTPVTPAGGRTPMRSSIEASLKALRRDKIYGCLVHRASELTGNAGARLLDELRAVKDAGLVEKIGVSVYTASEIDSVLKLFTPDIVQLPASVFDQRLIKSGHIAELKRRGTEVHLRSIFLQGLMLMAPADVPASLSSARGAIDKFDGVCRAAGHGRLQVALSFGLSNPLFDTVLVGVTSRRQLSEILAASRKPVAMDFEAFSLEDEMVLSPTKWKRG